MRMDSLLRRWEGGGGGGVGGGGGGGMVEIEEPINAFLAFNFLKNLPQTITFPRNKNYFSSVLVSL